MHQTINGSSAERNGGRRTRRHSVILRASSLLVASLLSVLLVNAVVPPIIADQSDRAVINAPVTLLTAPIDGEVASLSKPISNAVESGEPLARISNIRVDESALIALEQKTSDARAKLEATRRKKDSDRAYVKALDSEINSQTETLRAQFQSQIVGLRARVAESDSLSGAKKALVDRQSALVARNAASMDMLNPTKEQYAAALHNADAERAKLNQKIAQLDALQKGVYVGDDLVAIGILVQKRRDIDLDATRMTIEETELSSALDDQEAIAEKERRRLARLAEADVPAPTRGTILNVGAAPGRRVNAGDTLASVVDCDKRFVVAIFSYRQAQSMKVGTEVRISDAGFDSGVVSAILPKTSEKVDERFAVPFPQTERRELYAIVTPSDYAGAKGKPVPAAISDSEAMPCAVGRWVTVTKDNAVIPSMSVAWHQIGKLFAQGNNDRNQSPADPAESTLAAGIDALKAAFRSAASAAQRSMP